MHRLLGSLAGYSPNCAADCERAMAEHPYAYIYCEIFLAKLRRYLLAREGGEETHRRVLELMGRCARGGITSAQLVCGLQVTLAGHPRVLRALVPLLGTLDATINPVRSPQLAAAPLL